MSFTTILPLNVYPMEAAYPLSCRPLTVNPFGWLTALMSVKHHRIKVELAYWTEKRGTRKQNFCYNFHWYIFMAVFHGVNSTGCNLTTRLYLVALFRMNGTLPPLSRMPSRQLVTNHIKVKLFQSYEDILLILNKKVCVFLKTHVSLVYCTVCKYSYRKAKVMVVLSTPRRCVW
jgi:hypothetical protein